MVKTSYLRCSAGVKPRIFGCGNGSKRGESSERWRVRRSTHDALVGGQELLRAGAPDVALTAHRAATDAVRHAVSD